MLRICITVFFITLFLKQSLAQDANYWSSNYGPGGFFSPGAVIANNKDSGVMFYNPALLAYTNKNSASISANIYQYESINIKNGAGTGHNLKSTSIKIIPLMVSGTIALKLKKPFTIAYALINDPVINYLSSQRRDERFNVLNDSYSPGPEFYVGQYTAQNTITNTTGILSTGFKIAPGLAAGISFEGMIRKQNYREDFLSRAFINSSDSNSSQPIAGDDVSYQVTYTHIGLRFKAGLSYDIGRSHFGITLSSPLVGLYGTGTLVSDQLITNIKDPYSNLFYSFMANTRQTSLHPKYKMPFSVALGYSYDYGPGQIYLAAEYFSKINQYRIITPRDEYFVRPDTGNNNVLTSALLQFKDAHKSLVNFSLGISYELRPAVMGFFSLRTNFTYADEGLYTNSSGFTANSSAWNDYHSQIGINVKKRKFNFRAGLVFTYGTTNKYLQPINFDNPNEDNILQGNPVLTKATHFSAGLMLGYIYNL
jgi:hypothetical protein